jgi:hypothetical protein
LIEAGFVQRFSGSSGIPTKENKYLFTGDLGKKIAELFNEIFKILKAEIEEE